MRQSDFLPMTVLALHQCATAAPSTAHQASGRLESCGTRQDIREDLWTGGQVVRNGADPDEDRIIAALILAALEDAGLQVTMVDKPDLHARESP